MRAKKTTYLLPLILLLAFTGCLQKPRVWQEIKRGDLAGQLNQAAVSLYPERFKSIHRANLKIAGKDYVLNGYVTVDRPKQTVFLIVQSELSGNIFNVRVKKDQAPEITLFVKSFKESWLKKTVALDLAHLYLNEMFPSPVAVEAGPGKVGLLQRGENGIFEEYRFKTDGQAPSLLPDSFRRIKNGRCFYLITYGFGAGGSQGLPDSITIENKKMHYSLRIKAVYL